jgi:hypothetical protein
MNDRLSIEYRATVIADDASIYFVTSRVRREMIHSRLIVNVAAAVHTVEAVHDGLRAGVRQVDSDVQAGEGPAKMDIVGRESGVT